MKGGGQSLGLSAAMKKIASFFAHFTCIFIFCCSYRHSPQRIRKSITTRIRGHLFRCTFQHRSNIIGPHIDWCLFPFCRALFKIAEAGFFLSLPICFVSCSIPDPISSVSFYFQASKILLSFGISGPNIFTFILDPRSNIFRTPGPIFLGLPVQYF